MATAGLTAPRTSMSCRLLRTSSHIRCCSSNKSDSEANGARSSVRCVAVVGLPAAHARGATGHLRAWHWHIMPRFVPRPVARRRLLVLISDRTGLFVQPAHSPRANPADSKSRSWFIYVNSGPYQPPGTPPVLGSVLRLISVAAAPPLAQTRPFIKKV